jgi:DNA-directed RNA polymerase specialized sigma24 family protein
MPEFRSNEPQIPMEDAIDRSIPLHALSDQQRQVIGMLFQEGLSVEQAAARLGVEAQTIRSAKHKALTRLRERLAHHVGGVENSHESHQDSGDATPPDRYNQEDR